MHIDASNLIKLTTKALCSVQHGYALVLAQVLLYSDDHAELASKAAVHDHKLCVCPPVCLVYYANRRSQQPSQHQATSDVCCVSTVSDQSISSERQQCREQLITYTDVALKCCAACLLAQLRSHTAPILSSTVLAARNIVTPNANGGVTDAVQHCGDCSA
eukprot:15891-Heterococcus_DN1.PRE.4